MEYGACLGNQEILIGVNRRVACYRSRDAINRVSTVRTGMSVLRFYIILNGDF